MLLTIPYITVYCPPMTSILLTLVLYRNESKKSTSCNNEKITYIQKEKVVTHLLLFS